MGHTLTVVIADVDVLLVEHVSDLLERHGFHARIAPPEFGAVADWIRRHGADLCLVDISFREGVDLIGLAALCRDSAPTKVIVRTADTSREVMRAALDAGVAGYVHKSRGPIVLIESVRRVVDGEIVVEGTFVQPAAVELGDYAESLRMLNSLTPRQRECLELLAEGRSTMAMANELGVSVMTVRSHIQAMLTKLGLRSRLEAVSLLTRMHVHAPALDYVVDRGVGHARSA